MPFFLKSYLRCLLWLVISEILCLILAFSFAILRPAWIRWLSLGCGLLAHCLLMGSCAQGIANDALARNRRGGSRVSAAFSLLLGCCTALPLWLEWVLLFMNADSAGYLNAFLLLQAPFIQIHRVILNGAEPFSQLTIWQKLTMALPPLATLLSVWIGFQTRYISAIATEDAKAQPVSNR